MLFNRTGLCSTLLALVLLLPASAHALLICEEPLAYMLDTGLHPYLADKDFSAQRDLVRQFYNLNQQQLAWFQGTELSPQGRSLLGKIDDTVDTYLKKSIQTASQNKNESRCRLSLYDTALTIGGLRHLQSMLPGQQQPASHLLTLSQNTHAEQQLSELEPDFPAYVQLRQALKTYRQLAADPALSSPLPIPAKSVRPGDSYPAINQLIYKLQRWGDMETEHTGLPGNETYPDKLVPAVKQFQARHGLSTDGIVGKKTFRALNVPMTERVRQIELSLLRWRELPLDDSERILVVNIPQYKLFAFDRRQDTYAQTMEMKVIVGKSRRKHQTPVMSGEMTYLVFSPYWNIPYKILRDELYPDIIADPDYLASKGYQIVSEFSPDAKIMPESEENIEKLLSGELKLRQVNGRKNALGSIKFMFPNQYAVYMHGTPAMSLFKHNKRNFSHGCVRLADPAALAEYVLGQEQDWSRERIDEIIYSGKRKVVGLSTSLPVYMMYATAAADISSRVYFAQDVYQLDRELEQQLASSRPINPARHAHGQYPDG